MKLYWWKSKLLEDFINKKKWSNQTLIVTILLYQSLILIDLEFYSFFFSSNHLCYVWFERMFPWEILFFFFTFYTIQEMRATQKWVIVKMVVTNEL